MTDVQIRRAIEADLPEVYEVWHRTVHQGHSSAPPAAALLPLFRHELTTGHMWVAEGEDSLVGFAALLVRSEIAFLAELFVVPTLQSRGIGGALLQHALSTPATVYCTMSSRDPRALALYVRAGMRCHWPHFLLTSTSRVLRHLPRGDLTVAVADRGDPDIVAWDARIGGRERPEDHAYWQRVLGAVPLWFKRGDAPLGYGYVWRSPEGPGGANVGLGPLGVGARADVVACVGAALQWVSHESQPGARMHRVAIPGPHLALVPLLEAGFRISDVETFCCSRPDLFFDPQVYIAPAGPEGTSVF